MLETLLQPSDKHEKCGLVLQDGTVVEVKNVANNPVIGYLMDPVEVLPYLTAGTVAGTWHTHPSGSAVLSGEDLEGFNAWPDLIHHVIGWAGNKPEVRSYKIVEGAVVKCD